MGAVITQAMRSFAGWVTGRSYRLVLLAILFVQLLAPVAGALVVLDALRRGPAAAAISALIVLVGVTAGGLAVGASLAEAVGLAAPLLLGSAASGALLVGSRSLSLSFQGTVIGAIVLTFIVFTLIPGAERIGDYLLAEMQLLLEALGVGEETMTVFAETSPSQLVQFLLTTLLLSWLAGLMLGYWWYGLLAEGVEFSADFRALKLGRVAGGLLMLLVVLRILVPAEVVQYMAQLAVIGFLFQGLAVVHARSHSGNWHVAIVALVYVALFSFSPLALLAIAGLSVVGLLDNFFALRARVEPRD